MRVVLTETPHPSETRQGPAQLQTDSNNKKINKLKHEKKTLNEKKRLLSGYRFITQTELLGDPWDPYCTCFEVVLTFFCFQIIQNER